MPPKPVEKLRPRMGPLRRAAPTFWMPELELYGPYKDPIVPPAGLRLLGWATLALFCLLFYLGPASVPLAAGLAALGCRAPAAALGGAVALSLLWPSREWKMARALGQLWYPIFDFRHNLTDEWRPDEVDLHRRYCVALSPHGVVPVQAILWAAFCDQVPRLNLPAPSSLYP